MKKITTTERLIYALIIFILAGAYAQEKANNIEWEIMGAKVVDAYNELEADKKFFEDEFWEFQERLEKYQNLHTDCIEGRASYDDCEHYRWRVEFEYGYTLRKDFMGPVEKIK